MKKIPIEETRSEALLDTLTEVWEVSVRATHTFVSEAYINELRGLVRGQYLNLVTLCVIEDDCGQTVAFMGTSEDRIEMLFVRPEARGHGYGSELIRRALQEGIYKVDVNEENTQACRFYEARGFSLTGRDAVDPQGKPHPILHLRHYGYDVLPTGRLVLRPFRESDAAGLFECCRNPRLGDNAGWKPHESLEESRQILHDVFMHRAGMWAMVSKDTGRLIGAVGLVPDSKRENPAVRMLGYWLHEPVWGRGLMTEAVHEVVRYGFEVWRLAGISANCYPHNERSNRVLQRLGFVYEGTLHAAEVTYDGKIYDHCCYYLSHTDASVRSGK